MRKHWLTLALLLPLTAFCQQDTLIYSLVAAGRIQGFDKIWKQPDGTYEEWYQFNDRGRGDSLRVIFREDAQGFPVYIRAAGVDYMKNPVHEEFSWQDGKARWENTVEKEERVLNEKKFYFGLKSGGGHLVRALVSQNNKVQLLPYGEMDLAFIHEHEVRNSTGQLKKLRLAELKGYGFTPIYSWVDENLVDFAQVNSWRSAIVKGYESSIDELLAIQNRYEDAFFTKLAKTLPARMQEWVLLKNVNLFDAREARLLKGKDILIHNGVINRIAAAHSISQPAARIIDGTGMTVLPGLWDMHTHVSDNIEGIMNMAAGVTHIRDMGNGSSFPERAKSFREGEIIGPRVEVISGFIDGKDPMAAPTGVLISNVDEGIRAIHDFAAKGYQQIKLYSSIKPEWVKPLTDEAHRKGLRVCGHIPAFMTATEAIEAGYDEVTHLNMLALNFFGDTIDTRIPLRFSVPAQRTASLDLQGSEMKQFIQLLKKKNIAVDPTLNVFEDLFTARDRVVSPAFRDVVDAMPLNMQRNLRAGGGGLPVPDGLDETYKRSFQAFLNITRLLYENGITILPGTDGFAGFMLQRELQLYVQAGIPAAKVLQMATWAPAVYTGTSHQWGVVEEGRRADLVMVQGNPLEDMRAISHTRLVLANGKIYDPVALYRAISINIEKRK